MKTTPSPNLFRAVRRLVFAVLALWPSLSALADSKEFLTIYLNNRAKVCFPIADKPKMELSGQTLSIGTEHYLISNIWKYTFESAEDTGIDFPDNGKRPVISTDNAGQCIYIHTDSPKTDVQVFTTDGIRQNADIRPGDKGWLVIRLGTHPGRTYLIKVGDDTFKLRMR